MFFLFYGTAVIFFMIFYKKTCKSRKLFYIIKLTTKQ